MCVDTADIDIGQFVWCQRNDGYHAGSIIQIDRASDQYLVKMEPDGKEVFTVRERLCPRTGRLLITGYYYYPHAYRYVPAYDHPNLLCIVQVTGPPESTKSRCRWTRMCPLT